jgi:hypothetical protein
MEDSKGGSRARLYIILLVPGHSGIDLLDMSARRLTWVTSQAKFVQWDHYPGRMCSVPGRLCCCAAQLGEADLIINSSGKAWYRSWIYVAVDSLVKRLHILVGKLSVLIECRALVEVDSVE